MCSSSAALVIEEYVAAFTKYRSWVSVTSGRRRMHALLEAFQVPPALQVGARFSSAGATITCGLVQFRGVRSFGPNRFGPQVAHRAEDAEHHQRAHREHLEGHLAHPPGLHEVVVDAEQLLQ